MWPALIFVLAGPTCNRVPYEPPSNPDPGSRPPKASRPLEAEPGGGAPRGGSASSAPEQAEPKGPVRALTSVERQGAGWRLSAVLARQPGVTGPQRVSFGLPLPPGVLTDPTRLRVLGPDGVEVPRYVKALGHWRGVPPKRLLCAGLPPPDKPGIRSLLVQFSHAPDTAPPTAVTVEVGAEKAARTLDSAVPVASTWRRVS